MPRKWDLWKLDLSNFAQSASAGDTFDDGVQPDWSWQLLSDVLASRRLAIVQLTRSERMVLPAGLAKEAPLLKRLAHAKPALVADLLADHGCDLSLDVLINAMSDQQAKARAKKARGYRGKAANTKKLGSYQAALLAACARAGFDCDPSPIEMISKHLKAGPATPEANSAALSRGLAALKRRGLVSLIRKGKRTCWAELTPAGRRIAEDLLYR